MTHAELCQKAAQWLRRHRGCSVVATQKCIMTSEEPDAIGWAGRGASWLIEVKISRSDFLRDQRKPHRTAAGMGNYRYYLAPQGIIKVEELPEGWGLLEWDGRRVVEIKHLDERYGGVVREKNKDDEIRRLISLIVNSNYGCPQIEVVRLDEANGNA